MSLSIIDQVIEQLNHMPYPLQQQVLDFTHKLSRPELKGVSGQQLLRFADFMPADDLALMQDAIEQDCRQVDLDEW